jgi:hypothetical protein
VAGRRGRRRARLRPHRPRPRRRAPRPQWTGNEPLPAPVRDEPARAVRRRRPALGLRPSASPPRSARARRRSAPVREHSPWSPWHVGPAGRAPVRRARRWRAERGDVRRHAISRVTPTRGGSAKRSRTRVGPHRPNPPSATPSMHKLRLK